jgi:cation diffusion facilitator family transporter
MATSANRQQVRRVLLVTMIFNFLIAASKIVIGLATGALAITADGFHSLVDGLSNVVGLIANAIAARPPDDDHPYGHRRFETLAALLIGTFLALTAWEIARGALDRLQNEATITLTPLAFGVLLTTLIGNLIISTYETRQGKRLNSELLLADSANTRTDVFVTLSVIASMGLVALTGWSWIDAAAALVVVLLIARAAWRILWETGSVLVDTAPYSSVALTDLVTDVPGVQQVIRARSRGTADDAHIDIDAEVAPHMTTAQTAAIASAIRQRLTGELVSVNEVEVHFAPQQNPARDYGLVVRAAADQFGLRTHEVSVVNAYGRCVLDMHVEVVPQQSLYEAHQQVTRLEACLHMRLPEIDEIVSHIEPMLTHQQHDASVRREQREYMQTHVLQMLQKHYPHIDWHNLQLFHHGSNLSLVLHATLPAQITVEAAHLLAERAETLVRTRLPELGRVTIHTEPFDHNDRQS